MLLNIYQNFYILQLVVLTKKYIYDIKLLLNRDYVYLLPLFLLQGCFRVQSYQYISYFCKTRTICIIFGLYI
jgi:hypothetical protein